MTVALITGATSGIGAEFARQLAGQCSTIVLVARDAQRLAESASRLRAELGVEVEVISADLFTETGRAAVEARVMAPDHPVDVLVNNAGFGLKLAFDATDVTEEQHLLDLMVTAPMRLSKAALGQMLPRGTGTIINVASVAAFTPRGTYGAAKAWVISFSRWANLAYASRGVTVTAIAPGFVRTEFHERMHVRTDTVPGFLWLDAPRVVRLALRDVARGRAVSIPTVRYRLLVGMARILPARLAARGALHSR
jgi:short-subunit dehydrogenase